jgi:hypothetical protein
MKNFLAMLKRNAVVLAVAGFLSLTILGFGSYHYLKYGPVDFDALYLNHFKLGPRDDRWMQWEWIKSDPAYDDLWVKVQQLEERQVEKFAEAQWMKYKENPNDFFALYGWTYAALRAQSKQERSEHPLLAISQDEVMKNFARLPRNYEWARLRFILTVPRRPDKNYERLARRLLRVNPTDPDVLSSYIATLADLSNVEEKKRALYYLNVARKEWPAEYQLIQLEAYVYASLWHYEKKPEYARDAIALYKFYWNNESIEERKRSEARRYIEELEKALSEYQAAKK